MNALSTPGAYKAILDALIGSAYTTSDFSGLDDLSLMDAICRVQTLGNHMPADMLDKFEAEADRRGMGADLDLDLNVSELAEPSITFTATALVVTMPNGNQAKRGTRNFYRAAVVGYNANGKLNVLSVHYTKELAQAAMASFNAGKAPNHNYRGKMAPGNSPILVTALAEPVGELVRRARQANRSALEWSGRGSPDIAEKCRTVRQWFMEEARQVAIR